MEIKYEAVFGDQALFDGMMDDCEFASEEYGYMFANGVLYYCERYNEKAGWGLSCKSHLTFKPSAMRRIIRTPTWSVADQKAGKLPEVGCLVIYTKQGEYSQSLVTKDWVEGDELLVIAILDVWDDGNQMAVVKNLKQREYVVSPIVFERIKPIESPEEKAARLREEWCERALKLINKEISDSCDAVVIYDALLSGDLPVPVKE